MRDGDVEAAKTFLGLADGDQLPEAFVKAYDHVKFYSDRMNGGLPLSAIELGLVAYFSGALTPLTKPKSDPSPAPTPDPSPSDGGGGFLTPGESLSVEVGNMRELQPCEFVAYVPGNEKKATIKLSDGKRKQVWVKRIKPATVVS